MIIAEKLRIIWNLLGKSSNVARAMDGDHLLWPAAGR